MVEHFQEHHKETKPGLEHFKLEVLKRFAKCLERQIFEGYRIRNYKGEKIMNRRGDWGQNLPPQFSIEREKEAPPRKKTGRSGGPPTTGKGPPGPNHQQKRTERETQMQETSEPSRDTDKLTREMKRLKLDNRLNLSQIPVQQASKV